MIFSKKRTKTEDNGLNVIPNHLAIIMDGNGRWATKRHLPRTAGHKAGSENFVKTVDECARLGIKYLTVYAFSTENWNRNQTEVDGIMEIMRSYIVKYVPILDKKNIRLRILGDLNYFDEESRNALIASVKKLENNTAFTLCIALSYGGRHEILQAVNRLLAEGKNEVTEKEFEEALYTAGIPDPDFIIRTSGEERISNFLLWQSAYAEYYFTKVLWPDFDESELRKALVEFGKRKRRFGK
ncbi:MAG: di-trans,poly-cis-decaprenylcistransferase [Clostridia bacterium]|nr:di-trans,poly-cis-decaprenylcistransferase [Clostridia bacterium]